MNKLSRLLPLGFVCAGILFPMSASAENIVTQWNEVLLQAIRDTRPGPPIAARQLAIVHTGMFEAWAAYDDKAIGTKTNVPRRPLTERTDTNKREAISYGAYRTLVDLFPSQKDKFDGVMANLGYNPNNITTNTSTPAGIANVTSKALLEYRHHDGSNQLNGYKDYTGYKSVNTPTEVNDINKWQPLSVPDGMGGYNIQKFVTPHWGKVRGFALNSVEDYLPQLDIPAPKTIESDPVGFKNQAQQLLDISANLTQEQKAIAEYWSDGPKTELPPGHWNLFAQQVSTRDEHTIDEDVKMFFALNNSLLDASVACWDLKQEYDAVRPITAIHELFKGADVEAWGGKNQGTKTIKGEDWQPYQISTFVTPPFAEFPSGHSTYSAAGAAILSEFTGSDEFGGSSVIKAGSSKIEDGPLNDITLSWSTFSDAAEEAGLSRRYGGIHFEDGDLAGRQLGGLIAADSWEKAESYFSGTAIPEPTTILGLISFGAFVYSKRFRKKR